MSTWCAICTDYIVGHPQFEPLGRDGALVAVCQPCVELDARHYSFDDARNCRGQTTDGSRRVKARCGQ